MRSKKLFYSRENRAQIRKRTAVILLFFLLFFGLLAYRCFFLHLAPDRRLQRLSQRQYQSRVASRGTIYDARGEELAVSVPTLSLAARPAQVAAPRLLAQELSRKLSLSSSSLYEKLASGKKYVWIKHHLTPQEASWLKRGDFPGLEFVEEARRFYPNRELGAQILGAVGIDGLPLGGVELAYQEILTASSDLWLTLNKSIQYTLETELDSLCDQSRAKACTGIVMEPRTGAILAMASFPTFNPNQFQDYDWSRWKNRAITDGFEPGSIFKVILAAAALESGEVRPEDRFFCENGSLQIGKHVIHDHRPHGLLTFREILKVSSNIGFFKIGQRVGKKEFGRVIEALGFGQKTGIDFPGEENGRVRPVSSWRDIDFANVSFGQGVRVTPLQIVRAFAVIASGGYDVRPHFVRKVTNAEGKVIWEAATFPRRILKETTAQTLSTMLLEVTEEGGTGVQAQIHGYAVAGKTGTAQKIKKGRYSHTDFMSSFVGFAPASQPRVVTLIVVDEPRGEIYGGVVAAPAFRKVSWTALRELGVSPEEAVPSQPILTEAKLSPWKLEEVWALQKVEAKEEGVPDFQGLSMREVLGMLESKKIPAELIGSGVAYQQTPAPGTHLEKGQMCRIFFRSRS